MSESKISQKCHCILCGRELFVDDVRDEIRVVPILNRREKKFDKHYNLCGECATLYISVLQEALIDESVKSDSNWIWDDGFLDLEVKFPRKLKLVLTDRIDFQSAHFAYSPSNRKHKE
jgi:hypothetical protein